MGWDGDMASMDDSAVVLLCFVFTKNSEDLFILVFPSSIPQYYLLAFPPPPLPISFPFPFLPISLPSLPLLFPSPFLPSPSFPLLSHFFPPFLEKVESVLIPTVRGGGAKLKMKKK